jgi:hypothetical protein
MMMRSSSGIIIITVIINDDNDHDNLLLIDFLITISLDSSFGAITAILETVFEDQVKSYYSIRFESMITQHEKNSLPNILVSQEHSFFLSGKSLIFCNNLLIPNLKQKRNYKQIISLKVQLDVNLTLITTIQTLK